MPDGWVEDAIAVEIASGVPRELVVDRFQLSGMRALMRILEKPRVTGLVQAHRAEQAQASAIAMAKLSARCGDILHGLFEKALRADHPDSTKIGMWAVDKVVPNVTKHIEDRTCRLEVDVEVAGEFSHSVKRMEELGAERRGMFQLEEGDPHLHSGQKFMRDQEEALAVLGTETESQE